MLSGNEIPYEINAILRLSDACERNIAQFFLEELGLRKGSIQRWMHLTVYHGRRPLPGLVERLSHVHVSADTGETRFMVLAPGGENPRPEFSPRRRSLGIRLTKRNSSIGAIQRLKESVYRFETDIIIGNRHPTSPWRNCFGARNYQPHIKLLKPGNGVGRDLTVVGRAFREHIPTIEFDRFEIVSKLVTRYD